MGTAREREGNRGTRRGLSGVRQACPPLVQAMPPRPATRATDFRGMRPIRLQHEASSRAQCPSSLWLQPFSPHRPPQQEDTGGLSKWQGCVQQCPPPSSGIAPVANPPRFLDQRCLGRWRNPPITGRSLDEGEDFCIKPNSHKSSMLPINLMIFSSIHSPAPRP